ncbi:hypothetical protein [Thermodesulfatator indicus]
MKFKLWLLTLSFLWLTSSAWAITITVDGSFSDWGLIPQTSGRMV